jgi:hypothetical protein
MDIIEWYYTTIILGFILLICSPFICLWTIGWHIKDKIGEFFDRKLSQFI